MDLLFPVALAAEKETEVISSIPDFLMNLIVGGVALIVTFFLATFLRMWVQRIIRKKQGDQHKEVQILYGRVVFTSSLAIGSMISLTIVGVPLEWFSGGIGLGIAFALRSILANFFAGMVLLSNNKFNLGDFIIIDPETSGTIVDIQSRATSLRAVDGGEVTVPNTKMLESSVKCYTRNPIRRHAIPIGVGYKTDIAAACELIRQTVAANPNVQPEPPVAVLTQEVGDSAVVLEARFWTESKSKWWVAKSEITRDIFNALQKAGIDIPYPVQTLRVDADSSDLLAQPNHLLDNLKKIEQTKTEIQEEAFQQTPNEAAATPPPPPLVTSQALSVDTPQNP